MGGIEFFMILYGILTMIIVVNLMNISKKLNKMYKWNLENNKRKEDTEKIKNEEISNLLKELIREVKKEDLENNE